MPEDIETIKKLYGILSDREAARIADVFNEWWTGLGTFIGPAGYLDQDDRNPALVGFVTGWMENRDESSASSL